MNNFESYDFKLKIRRMYQNIISFYNFKYVDRKLKLKKVFKNIDVFLSILYTKKKTNKLKWRKYMYIYHKEFWFLSMWHVYQYIM